MIKNYQLMLKNALFGMTTLVLGFGPFVTATGGDGIATGTIGSSNLSSASPGQQAAFATMRSLCLSLSPPFCAPPATLPPVQF